MLPNFLRTPIAWGALVVVGLFAAACDDSPNESIDTGPAITAVVPNNGPLAGGTPVRITGSQLANAKRVSFGSAAGVLIATSDSELTVVTPHHGAAAVAITVSFENGSTLRSDVLFGFNGGAGVGAFEDITGPWLPADAIAAQDAAVADFDGDGLTDIFLPGYFGDPSRLFFAEATRFRAATACAPQTGGQAVHAEAGDVDGDGDVDLVVVNEDARNQLFLNDATGCFTDATATHLPPDTGYGEGGDLGDIDGDGDLDLVVANLRTGEQNQLLLNLGDGHFTDATHSHLPAIVDTSYSAELFDLDNDGDLDLAIGNYGEPNRIHLNNGAGIFTEQIDALPNDTLLTTVLLPGDVNGDGCADLFEAVFGGRDRLWHGDCTGRFTAANLQARASDNSYDGEWFDMDGDGDYDLAVAVTGGQSRLYRNDNGTLTNVTAQSLPAESDHHYSVEVLDAGGDGTLDLLFTTWKGEGTLLYLNGSLGTRSPALDRVSPAEASVAGGTTVALRGVGLGNAATVTFGGSAAAAFSVVADTWLTAVTPAGAEGEATVSVTLADNSELLLADRFAFVPGGGSSFSDASVTSLPPETAHSTAAVAIDIDGDSDVDLAVSDDQLGMRLLLNNGAGTFADASATLPNVLGVGQDLIAVDLDLDSDIDLVLALDAGGTMLLINDGLGTLTATTLAYPSLSVAAGDVDGDGDVDLLLAAVDADQLLLNDGAGGWLPDTAFPGDAGDTRKVMLQDIDGDLDLDVVAIDFLGLDRAYLNDGTGGFQVLVDPFADNPSLQSYSGTLGDVNGDDLPELVVAQGGATGQNGLFFNRGGGVFEAAPATAIPALELGSSDALVVDLDGDGDNDAVFATFWGTRHEVWENIDGRFQNVDWFPESDGLGVGVAAADFNNDGAIDVYIACLGAQDRLYLAR